jgi:hypothetical protein
MSSAFDPVGAWERVAAELRACKESQQQAWGDVDNTTLGRYLAGELSADEQGELEQILDELPDLRKLTDLVQDVMRGLEPIERQSPIPVSVPVAPLGALTQPRSPVGRSRNPARRRGAWVRRYAPLAAAACLLLTFGLLMPRSGFLSAPRPASRVESERAVAMRTPGHAELLQAPLIFQELPSADADREAAPVAPLSVAGKSKRAADSPRPLRDDTHLAALPSVEPQNPTQLNRAVTFYYVQGDVAKAEQALSKAHRLCKKKLGPKHRTTQWTARQLAGVYQVALNNRETVAVSSAKQSADLLGNPLARVTPASRGHEPYLRARITARQVREEITSRPAREVSTQVVPVLTQALQSASCCKERQVLVRALGELGPTARPAVRVLVKRLEVASNPGEQHVLLEALEQIGPPAQDAVQVLTVLCRDTAERKQHVCRLSVEDVKLAKKVLSCLTGAESRVGVFDDAGLFTARGIIDATRTLRRLARNNNIAVRIETGKVHAARSDLKAMGPRAVHVVFARDGSVQVHVFKGLLDRGLDPDQFARQLSCLCKNKQHDSALGVVVARVETLSVKAGK